MTLARLIASGGGTGLAPFAPGTVASLVAVLIGTGLLLISPLALAAAAILATIAGVWALRREPVADDPGWVVIDEFAGQWIALLGVGTIAPLEIAAAFVLFRVFDILKPGPVGWADRRHGVFGIMADDIIAGALAALVLYGARLAVG
jgi:phosphatidylglycerophosphatase A